MSKCERPSPKLVMLAIFGLLTSTAYAGSVEYEYDELGRLKLVTYPSGAQVEYSLDAAGNRTQVVSGTPPASVTITISNRIVMTRRSGGTTATYALTSAGDIMASPQTSPTPTDVGDWLTPKSGMGNFQVRATALVSTCSTGTMGSWLNLSANQTWTRQVLGGPGSVASCTFRIEIRNSSSPSVILGTADIQLVAQNAQ